MLGFFEDVLPQQDGTYSLSALYDSKDCKKKYYTPKRWLSQRRTKQLLAELDVVASDFLPFEAALSYALTLNPSLALTFYRKLSEIRSPVFTVDKNPV